ncbi:glycoprotease family-domain-containing protein [Umbelopsis sp. PMI_123]|nr:glycoprotease family-domain-containing protein [Umbelopsis sp. PMI_123]
MLNKVVQYRCRLPRPLKQLAHSNLHHRLYSTKPLTVLGIETSCDDTSAAVVTSDRKILSEIVRTQHHLHEPLGGIVPTLASTGHMQNLPMVICEALDHANKSIDDIDCIAVTRGPGLPPCLSVGMNAAKTLAAVARKPIIGVHHMEAHALTARLTTENSMGSHLPAPAFPFMTLLVSGGHTLLLQANAVGIYDQLGSTMDDAVGEAIDKASRALGLKWAQGRRGGPGVALEQAALQGDPMRYDKMLPLPLSEREWTKKIGFSFSGLKTAMIRMVEQQNLTSNEQYVADAAATFQSKCIQHLEQKLRLALDQSIKQKNIPLTALVVSGGVASNQVLRSRLQALAASYGLPLICPPPKLCTDNGVMIAWAGIERYQAGLIDNYEMTTIPKWPIEQLKYVSSN